MKTCIEPGCDSPVFGGNFCKYHQYRRYMYGGDLYKPKKKERKPIPKESAKRKIDNRHYRDRIIAFWNNAVEKKENRCFFCNKLMEYREDIHHILGRGKFLLEEEWWALAHRECHSIYHGPADVLVSQPWFENFMRRLKKKSIKTYYKTIDRINKAELEFKEEEL